jgi:hypothetical protein
MIESNSRKFAHPKVAKILPGMEGVQSMKASVVNSDEEKPVLIPKVPK